MDRQWVNNLCARLGVKLVKQADAPKYSRRSLEAPEIYHRLVSMVIGEERKRVANQITETINALRIEGVISEEDFGKVLAALFDSINDSHSKQS